MVSFYSPTDDLSLQAESINSVRRYLSRFRHSSIGTKENETDTAVGSRRTKPVEGGEVGGSI